MRDILNEYKESDKKKKKSLGNLYDAFVVEFSDNELKIMESNNTDNQNIEECFPLVMEAIDDKKSIINRAFVIQNDKMIKLSIRIITDDYDNIIGAFCVLLKCTPFLKLGQIARDILNFKSRDDLSESYPLSLEGIESYINDYGFESSTPSKNEKTEIIVDLYDMDKGCCCKGCRYASYVNKKCLPLYFKNKRGKRVRL